MLSNIIHLFKQGNFNSIVIYGATASGKSDLALKIANELHNTIIINADSMQVYKEMSIITAQPRNLAGHYIYGLISPDDIAFSVGRWLSLVAEIIKNSSSIPIIVGGSGMYISALINGLTEIPPISLEITQELNCEMEKYGLEHLITRLALVDPLAARRISDPQRVIRALSVYQATGKPISYWQQSNIHYIDMSKSMKIWVKPERNQLYQNINSRFIKMIDIGAIDEVQIIINKYKTYPKAIGLREIELYLHSKIPKDLMIDLSQQRTRNYAKRQETWFRNQLVSDITISLEISD